jgi:nitrogen-specific signal transduction histidine kinase
MEIKPEKASSKNPPISFSSVPYLHEILDANLNMAVVLDSERKIVAANSSFLSFLKIENPKSVIGQRLGTTLKCRRPQEDEENDCGETIHCRQCGANEVIRHCFEERSAKIGECAVQIQSDQGFICLEFMAYGTPFSFQDTQYCIVSLVFITPQKRKEALERTFFHDILNIAAGVQGLATMLEQEIPDILKEDFELLSFSTKQMLDEIHFHREVLQAENHQLQVRKEPVNSMNMILELHKMIQLQPFSANRFLEISPESDSIQFDTDPVLFRRILWNMIKNAMEASEPGKKVIVSVKKDKDHGVFSVFNHNYIPEEVQSRIFHTSFSTKGNGRGIGTYSMKLIGENYLHGKVGFTSDPERGTEFYIKIPCKS